MEVDGRGVARQIYRNTVISLNGKSASPETANTGNGDLFRRKRDIVVPCFLDNGFTNIFFCSCAVRRLHGFSLDSVFEFVVRKEGWDQLQAKQAYRAKYREAEDQFQRSHNKTIAKSLVAKINREFSYALPRR